MRDPESSHDSSLSAQIVARLSGAIRNRMIPAAQDRTIAVLPRGRRQWAIGSAIVLMIAGIPLTTAVFANVERHAADRNYSELTKRARPLLRSFAADGKARAMLARAMHRPGPAATIDRLAAVLPEEAMLVSVARGADGALTLVLATNDPDRLRGALRRDPGFAKLRDRGQRQGDGVMLVTLAETP
ncbi:MAG: hypothetical protein CMN72_16105 [Sphingomonas sp.]|nr:hypothetical protein [Sphingomonas sp.]